MKVKFGKEGKVYFLIIEKLHVNAYSKSVELLVDAMFDQIMIMLEDMEENLDYYSRKEILDYTENLSSFLQFYKKEGEGE